VSLRAAELLGHVSRARVLFSSYKVVKLNANNLQKIFPLADFMIGGMSSSSITSSDRLIRFRVLFDVRSVFGSRGSLTSTPPKSSPSS